MPPIEGLGSEDKGLNHKTNIGPFNKGAAMRIQIDETNTRNKGAELMFYAALEEIERKFPNATVIYNSEHGRIKNFQTGMHLKQRYWLTHFRFGVRVLNKLKIPHEYFTNHYPQKKIDLVLDAGGFRLSDQWNYSLKHIDRLESYYKFLKEQGTTVIFLPQAFGPFQTKSGQRSVELLNRYADLVFVRESISWQYLHDAGADMKKMLLYPDFTPLVKGVVPEKYKSLKGKVCVIPNSRMVTHTKHGEDKYLSFIEQIINHIYGLGKDVFLLNHEAEDDLNLCRMIAEHLKKSIQIVTDLNAKEVKGVIGSSSIVISSRFHGVASALNQGVPCLATSWSHKYKLLFDDYGQDDKILSVEDHMNHTLQRIDHIMDQNIHAEISGQLEKQTQLIKNKNTEMWEKVWNYFNQQRHSK